MTIRRHKQMYSKQSHDRVYTMKNIQIYEMHKQWTFSKDLDLSLD